MATLLTNIRQLIIQLAKDHFSPSVSPDISALKFLEKATVTQDISGPYKPGRVYWQGTWWPAKCQDRVILRENDICSVIGMDGITLVVEPLLQDK